LLKNIPWHQWHWEKQAIKSMKNRSQAFPFLNGNFYNENLLFFLYLLASLLGLSGLCNSLLCLLLTCTWLFTLNEEAAA